MRIVKVFLLGLLMGVFPLRAQTPAEAWERGMEAYAEGNLDSTVYWLQGAATGYVQAQDWDSVAWCYRYATALANYQEAFGRTVDLADAGLAALPQESYGMVRLLMVQGYAYQQQGDILNAYLTYERAYLIAVRQGYADATLASYLYRPLANLATRLGEYARARSLLDYWYRSLVHEGGSAQEQQEALNDLSVVWLSLEEPDSALTMVKRAPPGGTPTSRGQLALRQAEAHLASQRWTAAERAIGQALVLLGQVPKEERIWQRAARMDYLARAHTLDGDLAYAQQRWQQAETAYVRAEAIRRANARGQTDRALAKLLRQRATVALMQQDTARALTYVQEGLRTLTGQRQWQTLDSLYAENTFLGLLETLATVYAARNQSDSVRWALTHALGVGEQLWENLRRESAKLAMSGLLHRLYGQLVNSYFEEGTPAAYAEALYWHESHRAAVLQEQVSRAEQLQGLPEGPELLTLERRLRASLQLPDAPAALRYQWTLAYDTLQAHLKAQYTLGQTPAPPRVDRVQSWLAGRATGVISYAWYEEQQRLFGWRITQDTVVALRWEASALPATVALLDSMFTHPEVAQRQPQAALSAYLQASHSLYARYVEPLLDTTISHWVFLPDGPLQRVPLEALSVGPTAEGWATLPYLVQHTAISYLPALGWLLQAQTRSTEEPRLTAFAAAYPEAEFPELARQLTVRQGEVPLPFATYEVEQISQYFSGQVVLAATEAEFVAQSPKQQIVHLAMHAYTDRESPQRSGLQFSPGQDTLYDGFLYLGELLALDLQAKLVTLSACNTGVGPLLPGEGPLSLARNFLLAGAKGVTMSLWRVPDRETADLMIGYYAELAAGKAPATALAQAKRDYLMQVPIDTRAHPYFWAGFVHTGQNVPMYEKSHPERWLLLVMIPLLLLAAGFAWYLRARRKS